MQAYYNSVINGNKEEFLTEKQLENGPIAVDFDFRYDLSVKTKQYSSIHITSIIDLYLNILKEKVLQFEENETFPVYVFEKPNVNSIKDKNITKDGIHMIIGTGTYYYYNEPYGSNFIEKTSIGENQRRMG